MCSIKRPLFFLSLFFISLLFSCGIAPIKEEILFHSKNVSTINHIGDRNNTSFSILNWNIHKENFDSCFIKEVRGFVSEKNPTFCIFQEFLHDVKKDIRLLDNYRYEFAANIKIGDDSTFSGVSTYSRLESYRHKSYLSEGKEPISKTNKIFLASYYKVNGKKILIINIHAINFKVTNFYYAQQIDQMCNVIKESGLPVIVAGDFNSWKKSRIDILNSKFKEIDLKEVVFKGDVESFLGNPLDHIYYSKKFFTPIEESIKVLDFKSSDHEALYCEFQISNSL